MSPLILRTLLTVMGFPRVSGDEPDWSKLSVLAFPFSPRERG